MSKRNYYEVQREIKRICSDPIQVETNNLPTQSPNLSDHDSIIEWNDNIPEECDPQYSYFECYNSIETKGNLDINNLARDIAKWGVEYNVSVQCGNALLNLMRKHNLDVPKDFRTLIKTPQTPCEIIKWNDGSYTHIGLKHQLENFLQTVKFSDTEIKIDIGIDGVPLAKSSNSQLWPVLGNIPPYKKVFVIGVFHGYKKPNCANTFLKPFIEEVKYLLSNGITIENKSLPFLLRAFICDAPARAFVLGTCIFKIDFEINLLIFFFLFHYY